jgi:hypothetical protein
MSNNPPGVKYDTLKADYSLLDLKALEGVVRVLQAGAEKYSRDNWKHVRPVRRYFAAALRHLAAYRAGQQFDEETNESHLAHAVACLTFMLWHETNGTFSPEYLEGDE